MNPPDNCPVCGADVPPGAKACPQCGADEETGWAEDAYAQSLNLPGAEPFDHDEFVRSELAPGAVRPRGISWLWWAVAAILAVLFAAAWLRWR